MNVKIKHRQSTTAKEVVIQTIVGRASSLGFCCTVFWEVIKRKYFVFVNSKNNSKKPAALIDHVEITGWDISISFHYFQNNNK